jgi:Protein of unknown function (DUF1064)
MTQTVTSTDYKVLCHGCGDPLPASSFGGAQLKKKHPRCRACAPNKFSNQRSGAHQSKKESRRSRDLQVLQSAGLIRDLREQVAYELIPAQRDEQGKVIERACTYIADFVYTDPVGVLHVEDAKGMRTEKYLIKRKLMLFIHKIRIEEV